MYKPLPDCLTIKKSSIEGLGLFATKDINTNTFIGLTHIKDKNFENGYIRTPLGGFYNHSMKPNTQKTQEGHKWFLDVIEDENQLSPDTKLMGESLQDEIRQSLTTLQKRERDVIRMYFGIDMDYALTLNEIGEEFNLTRERVRQIKEKAIRRLRHRSRSKILRTYLG